MPWRPYPKDPPVRIPRLLELAREVPRPCMLRIPGVCCAGDSEVQCCACHGNSSIFGKGRSLKAHDFFSVWGCARCHHWLDESYTASGEERQVAFLDALRRQIGAWSEIATSKTAKPHDVDACELALDCLMVRGYALYHPTNYAVPAGTFPHA